MKKLFILLAIMGMVAIGCQPDNGIDNNEQTEQPGNNDNKPEVPENGNESGNEGDDVIFEVDSEGNYVVEAKGGEVIVSIATNIEYTVEIPRRAQSWLSLADSRAVRFEKLTFIVAKNESEDERSAVVNLLDANNNELESISFKQKAAEPENTPPAEGSRIATIEEQGANIKATIITLQTTKAVLKEAISTLKQQQPATRGNDNGNNGVKDMIAALEERVAALEQMIANLQGYTEGDLAEMKNWAEATFATMEQYNALAAELATLKAMLAEFDGVSTEALDAALEASEESMKQWVNEQLAGYATIADVDAQIAALTAALTEESDSLRKEIEALVSSLETLKSEVEESYKSAIESAINDFAGVINEQIAKEIAAVNKRIDDELATINSRLDDIEDRLKALEETVADLVTRIQSVSRIGSGDLYVITSAESSTVSISFEVAPKSTINELATQWEEYVKVKALYDGDTPVFVDMPITSFKADAENGLISIKASGDNLSDEFYTDLQAASLRLEISDGNNDRRSEYISIKARRWFREDIDLVPENDEIYYTTTDSNTLEPIKSDVFGANITTNLYNWKKGVYILKFDGDVTSVGKYAFGTNNNSSNILKTLDIVILPNSVTSIGADAFCRSSLTKIRLSNTLVSIGSRAFSNCHKLTEITIPESVTKIGTNVFLYCTELKNFYGKYASKDNYCLIIDGVLIQTASLIPSQYTLPDEVKVFGDGCIYVKNLTSIHIPDSVEGVAKNVTSVTECSYRIKSLTGKFILEDKRSMVINDILYGVAGYNLKEYIVPDGVTKIPALLMQNNSYLTSITLPESIKNIGGSAFVRCSKLKHVYCKATEPPVTGATIFREIDDVPTIFVPIVYERVYQNSEYWKDYADKIVGYDF